MAASDHRGDFRRPPLHPLEAALVWVVAAHLCFLPWALGTMHSWSQLTSLALAAIGFLLAMAPRAEGGGFTHQPYRLLWPATLVWRSPAFWVGVGFLTYLAVQALNPAWQFHRDDGSWWLEPISSISWLPSSVNAPFERTNTWRALTVFGSLALLLWSVWIGFSRRKSYRILFSVVTANGACLALLGFGQKLGGATRIFGTYVPSNDSFVASFIYPNHGGAYFYLLAALAAGLATWQLQRARARRDSYIVAGSYAGLSALCGLIVIFSYSRMSIALLLAFVVALGAIWVARLATGTGRLHRRPEFWPVVVGGVLLLTFGCTSLSTDAVWNRFADSLAHPERAIRDRALARQAAWEMLGDNWLLGWGAGCFRYGFPKYTKAHPAIDRYTSGVRQTWEHAHDDWLEFPIELGVVGSAPLLGLLGYGVWQLVRRRFWRNPLCLSLGLGCGLVLVHAWVDFVFQCPAVLLTWGLCLFGALRWSELDQPRGRTGSAG